MTKEECLEILNSLLTNTIDLQKILPMISEFMVENGEQNVNEKISAMVQQPGLIQNILSQVVNYYVRKFNIISIIQNNQIIAYY